MAPNTRSGSLKFERTTDGGWRVMKGGTARRLTTEELNEFADNFTKARLENEVLTKENDELEALMAQKDVQHHEELQEKESALDVVQKPL
jgi:flagellar motor component MotA